MKQAKQGFLIGHILEKKKIKGKDQDILSGRVFVYILKTAVIVQNKVSFKYSVLVRLSKIMKFPELRKRGWLNTNYMRESNGTDWVMGCDHDEILPEINRLRSEGFVIKDDRVSDLTSEFV